MRLLVVALVLACAGVAYAHPAVTKPCTGCHEDAHKGEFGVRACGDCHTLASWSPSTFGVGQHQKYALDGRHVATPCSGCHTGPRPRLTFVIANKECLDCHSNPHGTKFAKELVEGGCAGCHTAGNWKAWRVDHSAWPLRGAHDRIACAACHPGKPADAPAAAFRGVSRACGSCHDDVHAGQFASKDCTACHDSNSFRGAFDHTKTRYPLDGVHVDMACAKCHPSTQLRNGEQVVRWRLGYAECRDCHANPHPRVTQDCKSCHSATSWQGAAGGAGFDHAATGFALKGAHASTACGNCHATAGRPATACESCHRDSHQGRLAGACAECHTAVAWSDTRSLEQHRRTRMPLTGRHAVIDCADCHRRQGERTWSDVPVDCYACHRTAYVNATQPDHDGATPLSRDCARCHQTIAWTPAKNPTLLRSLDHRAFPLSGAHRTADCGSCHVDERRRALVRCDGCHTTAKVRGQHRAPVSAAAADCLRCHPRGVRR